LRLCPHDSDSNGQRWLALARRWQLAHSQRARSESEDCRGPLSTESGRAASRMCRGNGGNTALDERQNNRLDPLAGASCGDNTDRRDRLTEMPAEGTVIMRIDRQIRWRRMVGDLARRRAILVVRAAAEVVVARGRSESRQRLIMGMSQRANDAVGRLQGDG